MKTLLFFLLATISFQSWGQLEIPKGANTIVITDTSASIELIKTEFLKAGFIIDKSGEDYLTTDFLANSWYSRKFTATKTQNGIKLKAYLKSEVSLMGVKNTEAEVAIYKGSPKGANKKSFEELQGLAARVSSKISYE